MDEETQARRVLSKVASTFKFALVESDGDRLYESFNTRYQAISDIIDTLNDPTKTHARIGKHHPAAYYVYLKEHWTKMYGPEKGRERAYKSLTKSLDMNQFLAAGQKLAKYILQFKQIPKGKARSLQMALATFIKIRRPPRNLDTWWKKNAKHIQLMLDSRGWPIRTEEDDPEQVYKLGPFQVHNTLGLQDQELAKTNKAIESAVKFLRGSRIPQAQRMLYGPIMVVGKLQQPRTLAWYYPADDTVFLRPHLKVGKGEVHNLIHELGHRYWAKFFKNKRAWIDHHKTIKNRGHAETADPAELDMLEGLKVGDVFPLPISGMKRGGPPRITEITPTGWKLETRNGKKGYVTRSTIVRTIMSNNRRGKALKHFPTSYSSTDSEEHFAEAFAMYAMNTLPIEHKDAFEKIVLGS